MIIFKLFVADHLLFLCFQEAVEEDFHFEEVGERPFDPRIQMPSKAWIVVPRPPLYLILQRGRLQRDHDGEELLEPQRELHLIIPHKPLVIRYHVRAICLAYVLDAVFSEESDDFQWIQFHIDVPIDPLERGKWLKGFDGAQPLPLRLDRLLAVFDGQEELLQPLGQFRRQLRLRANRCMCLVARSAHGATADRGGTQSARLLAIILRHIRFKLLDPLAIHGCLHRATGGLRYGSER